MNETLNNENNTATSVEYNELPEIDNVEITDSGESVSSEYGKDPVFKVQGNWTALFKDSRLQIICPHSVKINANNYYEYKYNYKKDIDWFKRYILLLLMNGANVEFSGITREDFFNLGGTSIEEIESLGIDTSVLVG